MLSHYKAIHAKHKQTYGNCHYWSFLFIYPAELEQNKIQRILVGLQRKMCSVSFTLSIIFLEILTPSFYTLYGVFCKVQNKKDP